MSPMVKLNNEEQVWSIDIVSFLHLPFLEYDGGMCPDDENEDGLRLSGRESSAIDTGVWKYMQM